MQNARLCINSGMTYGTTDNLSPGNTGTPVDSFTFTFLGNVSDCKNIPVGAVGAAHKYITAYLRAAQPLKYSNAQSITPPNEIGSGAPDHWSALLHLLLGSAAWRPCHRDCPEACPVHGDAVGAGHAREERRVAHQHERRERCFPFLSRRHRASRASSSEEMIWCVGGWNGKGVSISGCRSVEFASLCAHVCTYDHTPPAHPPQPRGGKQSKARTCSRFHMSTVLVRTSRFIR